MKNVILCAVLVLVCACGTDLSKYTRADSEASVTTKMKACLINEANTRLTAGTLFNTSVTETARDMVGVCVKNLALQNAGISQESQSTAETIIQNLKNMASK